MLYTPHLNLRNEDKARMVFGCNKNKPKDYEQRIAALNKAAEINLYNIAYA